MLFFAGLGKLRNAHGTYVEGDYLAAFFEAMHVPTRLGVAAHTALAKAPAARRALGSFGVFFEVVLPWFLFRLQPEAACVGVLAVGFAAFVSVIGQFASLGPAIAAPFVFAFPRRGEQCAPGGRWRPALALALVALTIPASVNVLAGRLVVAQYGWPLSRWFSSNPLFVFTQPFPRAEVIVAGAAALEQPGNATWADFDALSGDARYPATWRDYEFPCKPGAVDRAPCQVRGFFEWLVLDHRLSFYLNDIDRHRQGRFRISRAIAARVLHRGPAADDALRQLLARGANGAFPFSGKRPRYIRVDIFEYRLTPPGLLARAAARCAAAAAAAAAAVATAAVAGEDASFCAAKAATDTDCPVMNGAVQPDIPFACVGGATADAAGLFPDAWGWDAITEAPYYEADVGTWWTRRRRLTLGPPTAACDPYLGLVIVPTWDRRENLAFVTDDDGRLAPCPPIREEGLVELTLDVDGEAVRALSPADASADRVADRVCGALGYACVAADPFAVEDRGRAGLWGPLRDAIFAVQVER